MREWAGGRLLVKQEEEDRRENETRKIEGRKKESSEKMDRGRDWADK